jgi:DNA-binding response OmpR family regulator
MKKILIIDDEKDFCFFLKKNLQKHSQLEILICDDALKAAEVAEDFQPDLILLDILMPHLSGPELARELKNRKATENTPVVFLTALSSPEALEHIGPNNPEPTVITKPIVISQLITIIDNLAG